MSNNPGTINPFGLVISVASLVVAIMSLYDKNPGLGIPCIAIFVFSAGFIGFQAIARRDPTLATLIFIAIAAATFFLGNYSAAVSEPQKSSVSKAIATSNSQENTAKDQFNQQDADKLVQSWLKAKSSILGDSFDQDQLRKLTTGSLYKDVNNVIYSLKSKGESYRFRSYTTKPLLFSSGSKTAFLVVEVSGEYSYNDLPFRKDEKTYTYVFSKEGSYWKITNYVKCDILTHRCARENN